MQLIGTAGARVAPPEVTTGYPLLYCLLSSGGLLGAGGYCYSSSGVGKSHQATCYWVSAGFSTRKLVLGYSLLNLQEATAQSYLVPVALRAIHPHNQLTIRAAV